MLYYSTTVVLNNEIVVKLEVIIRLLISDLKASSSELGKESKKIHQNNWDFDSLKPVRDVHVQTHSSK